jgi:hypothetical protein
VRTISQASGVGSRTVETAGGAVFNDCWNATDEVWDPDHAATNIHRTAVRYRMSRNRTLF